MSKFLGYFGWSFPVRRLVELNSVRKGDFTKENKWQEFFDWLGSKALHFQDIFSNY